MENIARIANSTRIASCSKHLLAKFCRNYSKNVSSLIETACKNLKMSAKIAKVTKNFIATTTKKLHPNKYRMNNKNNKLNKSSDL